MTIFSRKDPCARHRPVLTDWVEHRIEGRATPSAFEHLERCGRCELELTEIAQTVIALRRLAAQASTLEPPIDGWRDLRVRLEASPRRPHPAGRSRWGLVGSMLGPAIVAVLALRIAVPVAPIGVTLIDEIAGPSISSAAPRPLYDSGSGSLTEGIVLVLAGRSGISDGPSTWPTITPSSTDRREIPPAPRRAALRSETTMPRTATRS